MTSKFTSASHTRTSSVGKYFYISRQTSVHLGKIIFYLLHFPPSPAESENYPSSRDLLTHVRHSNPLLEQFLSLSPSSTSQPRTSSVGEYFNIFPRTYVRPFVLKFIWKHTQILIFGSDYSSPRDKIQHEIHDMLDPLLKFIWKHTKKPNFGSDFSPLMISFSEMSL